MPIERSERGLNLWRPKADREHVADFGRKTEIRRSLSACLMYWTGVAFALDVVRLVTAETQLLVV